MVLKRNVDDELVTKHITFYYIYVLVLYIQINNNTTDVAPTEAEKNGVKDKYDDDDTSIMAMMITSEKDR